MDVEEEKLRVREALRAKVRQLRAQHQHLQSLKMQKYQDLQGKLDRISKEWPSRYQTLGDLVSEYKLRLDVSGASGTCSIADLVEYLKKEKSLSSGVYTQLENLQTSETAKHHQLIKSNQYNLILGELTLSRHLDQIDYINRNVFSKSTFVYQAGIASNKATVEEIQVELKELERIIQLNSHCQVECPKSVRGIVKRQFQREKEVYDLMSQEIKAVADETSKYKQFKLESPLRDSKTIKTKNPKNTLASTLFVGFNPQFLQSLELISSQPIDSLYTDIKLLRTHLTSRQLQE